jgi:DNA-binding FrmR family transcriptional regulator
MTTPGDAAPASPTAATRGQPDCLHLDPDVRLDAARRLKSVKGHVEGVQRMLENPDVYCVDVLKQVAAVQGALRKVSEAVLRSHVRDHVATAALRGDTEHLVDELMEALKYRG